MEYFLSVIQSVYTDGILRSVYTDGITDRIFRIKKKTVCWRGSFCGRFYRRNHRAIQTGSSVQWHDQFTIRIADRITERFEPGYPYSDVIDSPSELPTESPTEVVCRWFHRQKLIYDHSADPLLPYFSFFFPIPTLPSQTASNQPPPKKQISLFSARVIFL